MGDAVDTILQQWRGVRPDLDHGSVGVAGRIARASRLLEGGLKEFFVTHGLDAREFEILAALLRSGPGHTMTAGELSSWVMISSAALTNRADRLVEKGLVTRKADPANRRSVLITLTAEGRTRVEGAIEGRLADERRLLAGLTARERDQLAALLRKLLLARGDVPTR
ncbi:MarR family winged helix-turn-helix transcriptional regulator [Rhizohabitans arisaemae]|uniref:MarR family winged helix-turn-helix transcriptional regulator n=1 Tax=Rhizohabitans arisaemae TaxID=2720610 RepID=UPI0024B21D9B|nr:MarR family transcriptional regulator [Rhizohabitans arisaemae]